MKFIGMHKIGEVAFKVHKFFKKLQSAVLKLSMFKPTILPTITYYACYYATYLLHLLDTPFLYLILVQVTAVFIT